MDKKNYRILIVDDEIEYQRVFAYLLQKNGYSVLTCSGGKEALELLLKNEIDLIMTDLKMPDMDGIELIRQVKAAYEEIDIMVITAFGSIESAVDAMKYGATGYSIKNSEPEALLLDIDRMAKIRILERENRILQQQTNPDGDQFLQSENPEFRELLETCKQVAASDINILILGESGAGKEVIARYIHKLSARSEKHFIPVNCQVFAEGTLESELFGHEKGAFTGATEKRIGRFEAANQGTLFLDEIGDIPLSLQGKLLRVLEGKEIERVGSNKPIELDIRLISATNKDLARAIGQGVFREDLLYRINTLTITVPPLRERKEDLPMFVEYFVRRIGKEQKKKIRQIDPGTLEFLYNYDYPGNVRELKNLLERMVVLSEDGVLRSRGFALPKLEQPACREEKPCGTVLPLRKARGIFEKEHIERALEITEGNVAAAAVLLEITKRQLWNKIAEYNIQR
ncbi:sigma-54-dependent transcriptional regulator [Bacilliculturomica massiliensis]|uniref:sigma-54-dependent transcriptional regulator n=1 Tax=Bacilliculturomica massiliensis TaxID=1917867 RepID=UPI001030AAE4|nr:sigma-54 dependent transcriptional regulator [Bacilliculturomica massiliensis]